MGVLQLQCVDAELSQLQPLVPVHLQLVAMPPTGSTRSVRDGMYEIVDNGSGQYLNSIQESIYNGFCDDALILQDRPTRFGKVRRQS